MASHFFDRVSRNQLLLVGLTCAIHLLLVLSDARFLDGTYFEYFLQKGDWEDFSWEFYRVFMPLWPWLMRPLLGAQEPGIWLRAAELLSLVAIALSVERSARKHAGLANDEALLLGTLIVAVPAYGSAMMSNTVIYLFPTALFYVGWTIYLDLLEAERAAWPRKIAAAALWWVAFYHNSLLVLHYGFLVLFFVLALRRSGGLSWSGLAKPAFGFVRAHALAILLPVAFFAARYAQMTQEELGSHHNPLFFIPLKNLHALAAGLYHHVVLNMSAAFANQVWLLALAGLGSLASIALAWRWRKPSAALTASLGLFGAFFAVAGYFPYAVALKLAPLQSFGARFGILTALGSAMLLLAMWRTLPERPGLRLTVALLALAGLAARGVGDDLMWLGRWAKDRAIIKQLSLQPAPAPGTIMIWHDSWPIGHETYRPFEISWFNRKAWGSEAWAGIDAAERDLNWVIQKPQATTDKRDKYLLSDFEMNGCVRHVSIAAAELGLGTRRLGLSYLADYWFDRPALEDWLSRLVKLDIGPADCETLPQLIKASRAAAN